MLGATKGACYVSATKDLSDTVTIFEYTGRYKFLNKRMFCYSIVSILMYLYCLITVSCFKCLMKGESQDALKLYL